MKSDTLTLLLYLRLRSRGFLLFLTIIPLWSLWKDKNTMPNLNLRQNHKLSDRILVWSLRLVDKKKYTVKILRNYSLLKLTNEEL